VNQHHWLIAPCFGVFFFFGKDDKSQLAIGHLANFAVYAESGIEEYQGQAKVHFSPRHLFPAADKAVKSRVSPSNTNRKDDMIKGVEKEIAIFGSDGARLHSSK
jgi:hypothetical protein